MALARAILKDAPIVVLDEATAFADPENEALIQKAFARLTEGRTVIMIAHRLSTVVGADKIVVLDSGRVVGQGTHEELLKADGLYARMWADYQQAVSWRISADERERRMSCVHARLVFDRLCENGDIFRRILEVYRNFYISDALLLLAAFLEYCRNRNL